MIRFLFCAGAYSFAWFLLGSAPFAGAVDGWRAIIAIHAIAGPIIMCVPIFRKKRYFVFPVLFARAIFSLVIGYPCMSDPALAACVLTLFAVESVSLLDGTWPATFAFLAFMLAFMVMLPRKIRGIEMPPISTVTFAALACYLAFAVLCARKVAGQEAEIKRRKDEAERQKTLINQVYLLNAQFQEYALNAERRSAEEERKRITRDIHDIMGYTLVNLRVMLEVSLDLAGRENEKLSSLLSDAIRHTQEGLQSARKALRNLRAIDETDEFWMNRLNRIIVTFSGVTGVDIRVSWGNVTRANCPRIKGAVYQFVQESLTNSFKHGEATQIDLDFAITGAAPDDRFMARIVDNGRGAKDVIPGIGFAGISERAEQLDGTSGYRSLESGFEAWISIPMLSMRKET